MKTSTVTRRFAFALAVFLPWPLCVGAAERLVQNQKELAAATRDAKPGDVIVLRDGVWKDTDILLEAEGTETNPITLRAQSPGKVILAGQSRLRIAGKHLVVAGLHFRDGYPAANDAIALRASSDRHAHHCRVTNCAITAYNPPDRNKDTKWISLYGTHNRVDHCSVVGKENAGPTLVVWLSGQSNHHRIDHNYFGPRPRLGANGGETIRVGTSDWQRIDSRTIVEHNLFEECDGEIEIISSKSCANIYRFNTFRNCQGALTLRHGDRCHVHGNFFLGNGQRNTGGVRVIGEDHKVYNNYFAGLTGEGGRSALSVMNGIVDSKPQGYFQVKRLVLAHNTFVDCKSNLLIGLAGGTLPPADCVIVNNIVSSNKGTLISEATKPTNLRWEANILHGTQTAQLPANSLLLDPRLELAAAGLWRPAATSPALGKATAGLDFLTDDIDGQPRGSKPDIGCDQLSDAPIQNRPLTLEMVGPSWK